jgi:hypothetical protein
MYKRDSEFDEGNYEPKHIDQILAEIGKNFPAYWESFAKTALSKFDEAIEGWDADNPAYAEFLDLGFLNEYEDDPNAFKGALRSKCPIIRKSLNSPTAEMKKYKIAFNGAKGRDLLAATHKISLFGVEHMKRFDDAGHVKARSVDDLSLADLEEEEYGVYGAIGGGIRSQFLYALYPNAFPYRSRPAIWALYFLSGKGDFGSKDGSEFLMIDVEHTSTQQNYFYPYHLFSFYALKVYGLIAAACAKSRVPLRDDRRYVYVDAFLNHVAAQHEAEVTLLKGEPEDFYAY